MREAVANETPAADRLHGVEAIADFLGLTKRQAHWRIDRGELPVGREGGRIVASRKRLRRYWDELTGAAP